MRRIFQILILSSIAFHTSSASASDKNHIECKLLMERVETNNFAVSKGLFSYASKFGQDLLDTMASLTQEDYWIDMGAGQARAQLEYVLHSFDYVDHLLLSGDFGILPFPEVSKRASAIAISFKFPYISKQEDARVMHLHESSEKSKVARFQYLEGRYLDEIPDDELPKAKLITDHHGIMAYTLDPTKTLQRYVDTLANNGYIYMFGMYRTEVLVNGEVLQFFDFLKQVPGLRIKELKTLENGEVGAVRIRLDDYHNPPKIPMLTLVSIVDDSPPYRVFEFVGNQ